MDAIKDLALKGLTATDIQRILEKREILVELDQAEIDAIITEVKAGMNLVPERPSRVWSRVIGIIAILLGFAGLAIGTLNSVQVRRYSPAGGGLLAVILGTILVIKPSWSDEDLL